MIRDSGSAQGLVFFLGHAKEMREKNTKISRGAFVNGVL